MIEVILLERIEKLGQMGDVVRVKPGFARNYLLPKRKALRATKDNLAYFEKQRAQLEAENLQQRQEAEQVAGRLEGTSVTLVRQAGESGQLYGSVNARDIADALKEAGTSIDRRQVQMNMPIKALGLYYVPIILHPEVSVTVTVNVAVSEEAAKRQATEVARQAKEAAPAKPAEPAATGEGVEVPATPETGGEEHAH